MSILTNFLRDNSIENVYYKPNKVNITVETLEIFLSQDRKKDSFYLFSDKVSDNNELYVKSKGGDIYHLIWVKQEGLNKYVFWTTNKNTCKMEKLTLQELIEKLKK